MNSRRSFFKTSLAAGAATLSGISASAARAAEPAEKRYQGGKSPWPICLDTATIRPASLEDKIKIAAKAGYDAIEPWEGELNDFEAKGGNLKELGKRIREAGLFVPSVIGLWDSIPETQELWDKALPNSRRRMRQASELGAEHIQVVPQPARPLKDFDPRWAASRYKYLLEIGEEEYNINPAMVFVNFLEGSRTMGQAAQIAIDANHPKAKIIPDLFHMYTGGTDFVSLRHIQGSFIAIFQFNDVPGDIPKEELKDKDRVFPGDGIFPLVDILKDLKAIGYRGCVSLELYNEEYYKRDLRQVAEEGLRKTLAVIEKAGV